MATPNLNAAIDRVTNLLRERWQLEMQETERLTAQEELDRKLAENARDLIDKMRRGILWTGWLDAAKRNKKQNG